MVTPIYAAILTFIIIYLSMSVTKLRKLHHVGLGDGGHEDLIRAIRTHGNCVETAPWAILLMFLVEYQDGNFYVLHFLGLLLIVSRVLHMRGMMGAKLSLRVAGMISTFTVFGIAALYNFYLAFTVGV